MQTIFVKLEHICSNNLSCKMLRLETLPWVFQLYRAVFSKEEMTGAEKNCAGIGQTHRLKWTPREMKWYLCVFVSRFISTLSTRLFLKTRWGQCVVPDYSEKNSRTNLWGISKYADIFLVNHVRTMPVSSEMIFWRPCACLISPVIRRILHIFAPLRLLSNRNTEAGPVFTWEDLMNYKLLPRNPQVNHCGLKRKFFYFTAFYLHLGVHLFRYFFNISWSF